MVLVNTLGMSSQLDICFLDSALIVLSDCLFFERRRRRDCQVWREKPFCGSADREPGCSIWTLLRGKVINESDLHPFILTFLSADWSRVQSFLVWSLFREESSSSKTDIFDLLHSVTTRVFWQLASMSEFSSSPEFTRVSEDVCVCFCSVFQTLDWARMQCWGT